MKPFIHKSFIGNFFDVLHLGLDSDAPTFASGGTRQQEAIVSIIAGNFDLLEIPQLVSSLNNLLTTKVKLIVLDLSNVHYFSTNAVGVLVNFAASVEGRTKRLILYRPGEPVVLALATAGLNHLFTVRQTKEELLLSLPD